MTDESPLLSTNTPSKDSSGHTPGPWHHDGAGRIATRSRAHTFGGSRTNVTIASMSVAWKGTDEMNANARLISAAPDLLSAAEAVVARWDTPLWKDAPATAEYIHGLRAAIAKARSKSSGGR